MSRQQLGATGEPVIDYLKSHGFTIIEANIHTPFGDVDVLARSKDGTVVFLGVQKRSSSRLGSITGHITPIKRQQMVKSAEFVYRRRFAGQRFRLDLIWVDNRSVTAHTRNLELN